MVAPPLIEGYQIELVDEQTLDVAVPKNKGLNPLFTELGRHGIEVSSLKNKSNRLEQLFTHLVQ